MNTVGKIFLLSGVVLSAAMGDTLVVKADELQRSFVTPPDTANAWCYWWWLNGAASKEGITRDFKEMKRQGIAGALLFDAGKTGADVPRGPHFMSPEWRDLYKHAVREADRLGIVLGVNLCSGWDCGGAWVTPEQAAKKLVGQETVVRGPGRMTVALPQTVQGLYRDIAVLAHPMPGGESPQHGRQEMWDRRRIVDLTESTDGQGRLTWEVPTGAWRVLRIGYTLHGKPIQCVGSGPGGLEIDPMDASAMDAHFAETGAKLIADAGPLAGKSLQYFHIDSWELGQPTWTPAMRQEFQARRGYDPLSYLPALLEKTVDSKETTQRFLADYRRTVADLVAANYYGRLRELTRQGGLRGTHPESGGPFFKHWIDGLQCEGINDIPMGEFWKRTTEPSGPVVWAPNSNPSVKQAACAAHIYGKPICQAEAFTSSAPDWTADPWNMKDIGDEAFCHGITRYVLCFWVHQPQLDSKPGYQWAHTGTHFDPNITWWDLSHAWLTYIARCQHMLRQGLFVADFAYFRGEDIPGFIAPRGQQKPMQPAGFDYDVLSAEVLRKRANVKNGRLTLPDGMSYRYLVLPDTTPLAISPDVLRTIKDLAHAGVTVIGPKPDRAPGLSDYPRCDQQIKELADELWGEPTSAGDRKVGAGRLVWGRSLSEVVQADSLPADVEFRNTTPQANLDWIHRRDGQTDIYFLSNQAVATARAEGVFRVRGKQPELWDAVTGEVRDLPQWRAENGRTVVPLLFAPRQSFFVVFRKQAEGKASTTQKNFPERKTIAQIEGPWQVSFDPKWGGPKQVTFDQLEDWTKRPEEGIRYYSGTAVYRKQFRLPSSGAGGRLFLDLGAVKNVARVKLNGRDLGVVWTAPPSVEITGAVRPGTNDLEIEVVNLWPNRLMGDAILPKEKRFTVTNDRIYDRMKKSHQPANLLPSGLFGPVTLHVETEPSSD